MLLFLLNKFLPRKINYTQQGFKEFVQRYFVFLSLAVVLKSGVIISRIKLDFVHKLLEKLLHFSAALMEQSFLSPLIGPEEMDDL